MAVSDQRVAPLTFGQLSVWRDVEDLPIDRAHEANLADVWTVPREVHPHRIVTAFEGLTRRHEGLRIRYDDGPRGLRMILPGRADRAPVRVLREDAEHTLKAVVDAELAAAVDLSVGPGWRAAVVAGPESTAVVVLSHHITTDAWATNQWAPALFERLASYPLTEAAVIVQHTTLDASRHGEYDVDELAQLRHDLLGSTAKASALAVNFVAEPPTSPVNTAGDREQVMITRPFTVLYAQPCYIKIYDQNPDLLIWITSRLAGDAGTAVKIMMSLRDDLTTAATR